jgi:hypothetical protein
MGIPGRGDQSGPGVAAKDSGLSGDNGDGERLENLEESLIFLMPVGLSAMRNEPFIRENHALTSWQTNDSYAPFMRSPGHQR